MSIEIQLLRHVQGAANGEHRRAGAQLDHGRLAVSLVALRIDQPRIGRQVRSLPFTEQVPIYTRINFANNNVNLSFGYTSWRPAGCNFLVGDGSVQCINYDINYDINYAIDQSHGGRDDAQPTVE